MLVPGHALLHQTNERIRLSVCVFLRYQLLLIFLELYKKHLSHFQTIYSDLESYKAYFKWLRLSITQLHREQIQSAVSVPALDPLTTEEIQSLQQQLAASISNLEETMEVESDDLVE